MEGSNQRYLVRCTILCLVFRRLLTSVFVWDITSPLMPLLCWFFYAGRIGKICVHKSMENTFYCRQIAGKRLQYIIWLLFLWEEPVAQKVATAPKISCSNQSIKCTNMNILRPVLKTKARLPICCIDNELVLQTRLVYTTMYIKGHTRSC